MTLPGDDPGDKPRDVAGEGLSADSLSAETREASNRDVPPPQQSPAYEHQPPSGYQEPSPSGYPPPQYGTAPGYGSPVPPGGFPPAEPYGYGYPAPQHTNTSTMAIASLVFSVLGIVPFCGGILSIVGIVLGAVALSQIKETRQEGYGIAVAGIVVGVAMLIVGLIWTIFALR